MFSLELTTEKAAVLVKVLSAKAKEIHAWRAATKSVVRDEEYDDITDLLKSITLVKRKQV